MRGGRAIAAALLAAVVTMAGLTLFRTEAPALPPPVALRVGSQERDEAVTDLDDLVVAPQPVFEAPAAASTTTSTPGVVDSVDSPDVADGPGPVDSDSPNLVESPDTADSADSPDDRDSADSPDD